MCVLLQLHTKHTTLRNVNTVRYKVTQRRIYTKTYVMWNKVSDLCNNSDCCITFFMTEVIYKILPREIRIKT